MHIENWFPTPVFYSMAAPHIVAEIEQEYLREKEKIAVELKGNTWGDNINTTFESNINLVERYQLNTLNKYVCSMAGMFAKEIFEKECQPFIAESWINISGPRQYQEKHCHLFGPWNLSGVYYLETNGNDGSLRMHAPNQMHYIGQKNTKYTHQTIEYKPEKGKIILFPSWAEHSVRANMTDSDRVSIAFNIHV